MNLEDVPVLHPPPIPTIRPGQLLRWNFTVRDGFWMFQRVTSEARIGVVPTFVFMKRGEVFTVIATDDAGPFSMDAPTYDNEKCVMVYPKIKRWHVILIGDTLAWLEHDWFEQGELLTDTV
jgi:hypothetical protein